MSCGSRDTAGRHFGQHGLTLTLCQGWSMGFVEKPIASPQAIGAQPAVVATGLRKSFGDHVVLDGIDLDVAEGTVYALLGPNGSGKTTTVQILSTLLPADAGTIRVAGHDVDSEPGLVRAAIGVTGQFSAVDNLLTGQENLVLMADLNHLDRAGGRQRAAELLSRFDLAEAAGKMAATYSGGMRRQLDLAMTLVGDPRIIFLDEPTTGLDPRSRRSVRSLKALLDRLEEQAIPIGGLSVHTPDLNDVFFALTGHPRTGQDSPR
jgi:ABC-type multidrug transport system ATPase subunit